MEAGTNPVWQARFSPHEAKNVTIKGLLCLASLLYLVCPQGQLTYYLLLTVFTISQARGSEAAERRLIAERQVKHESGSLKDKQQTVMVEAARHADIRKHLAFHRLCRAWLHGEIQRKLHIPV